jgi:outer membrane biosynthesis protein TonB
VVLQFSLHQDGRISDMNVAQCSTSEMLSIICQKAVRDPEPYAAWTTEMRRTLGEVRKIQFTFYYN